MFVEAMILQEWEPFNRTIMELKFDSYTSKKAIIELLIVP